MIITIANKKGGVSKTTTIRNLLSEYASQGYKVLAVDTDPQGNLSKWLGIEKQEKTVSDALMHRYESISEIISSTNRENVDCICSDDNLSITENEIAISRREDQAVLLLNALKEVEEKYDLIFIDTSPFFNLTTINAMASSNLVIVPIKMESDAILGAISTINEAQRISDLFGRPFAFRLLVTMKSRTNNAKESITELKDIFHGKVFETEIRYQENPVTLSVSKRKSVKELYKDSKIASEFEELAKELAQLIQLGGN